MTLKAKRFIQLHNKYQGNFMFDQPNTPAIVRQAEVTEQQLIVAAKAAVTRESESKWEVGRFAHEWTERFAKGRTDGDFAELVGLSRKAVQQRRQVFESFGDVWNSSSNLTWTHYRETLDWDDAEEWLAEADKSGWSVATMKDRRVVEAKVKAVETSMAKYMRSAVASGVGLKSIRDERLYRGTHRTFDEFARKRFGLTSEEAALEITTSEGILSLSDESEIESAIAEDRPLRFTNSDNRRKAWKLMEGLFEEPEASDSGSI